jgi:hypothetical protein
MRTSSLRSETVVFNSCARRGDLPKPHPYHASVRNENAASGLLPRRTKSVEKARACWQCLDGAKYFCQRYRNGLTGRGIGNLGSYLLSVSKLSRLFSLFASIRCL